MPLEKSEVAFVGIIRKSKPKTRRKNIHSYLMFNVLLTDATRQTSEKAPLKRLNGSCQVMAILRCGRRDGRGNLTHFPPHFRIPHVSRRGIWLLYRHEQTRGVLICNSSCLPFSCLLHSCVSHSGSTERKGVNEIRWRRNWGYPKHIRLSDKRTAFQPFQAQWLLYAPLHF